MKTIILFVLTVLLIGYSIDNQVCIQRSNCEGNNSSQLYCPSAPTFAEKIKNEIKDGVAADIDQSWYQKAVENIQKDEYNISYSEELGAYQSPNRSNNMRFIYHKDGFIADRRDARRETGNVWKIQLRITNFELLMKNEELKVSGNKAYVENDKIRIDYTNTKDGMRQDFIVKQKQNEENKLKLNFTAETDLNMIVGEDALIFKDNTGYDVMKYSALKCWDANGQLLSAYFEKNSKLQIMNYLNQGDIDKIIPNSFSIVVNDQDAVYPITIDPLSTSSSWSNAGTQGQEQFGFRVATAGDVNGDGYSDIVIGAPEFDNSHESCGKVYVYYGSETGPGTNPNWTKEEISQFYPYERFGFSVATAGDVNGDGYSDLIVGAMSFTASVQQSAAGKAFVYHGSSAGLSSSANWSATYSDANCGFGYSVSTAGDINGDGYSDVIIGAPFSGGVSFDAGTAFVYNGSASGLNSLPNWSYNNTYSFGWLGYSVSTAGDVNADGYSDVIIGVIHEPNGPPNVGKAISFYGSASGLPSNPNWTVFGSQQNQERGNCVSTAGDVNGDGYSDVIVCDWLLSNVESHEGRIAVFYGSSSGLNAAANWTAESNQVEAVLGSFASTAGDVNGDGYADIIAGAKNYINGQSYEGKVFAWFGSSAGLGPNGTPANADWSFETNEDTAYAGSCVATAGDVNGDGYSDILVSANQTKLNGDPSVGKVYLFTGSALGLSSQSTWTNEGNQDNAFYGYSVSAAGDVNGDGYSDVIVGAYLYDNGQTDEGKIFVYLGSATGLSTAANTTSESNSAGAQFGYSVSTAGDINGDGFSDVLVGGPGWAGTGRVYIFHGSSSGLNSLWNYSVAGDAAGDFFGNSVSTAGDVNGDGYSDIIVGAEKASNGQTQEGKAVIFYGASSGLNTIYTWSTESNQENARLGYSVSNAGDVNGDGYSDIIIGSWTYDNGQNDEGAVWVWYGSLTGINGSTFLERNVAGAEFGASVSSAGDVNGDGFSDVIVGASSYSNPEFIEGAAFVFNGSSTGISETPNWNIESNQTLTNLGISVATAGDVNGDGYSDVIVGAFNYDNGQTDEGRIQVHYGSQNGLNSSPNWIIESNAANANLGISVSSAGDVNGDGYSDIIAGAFRLTAGNIQEGKAFVYYGGGGSGNSRANVQQYSPGSSSVVGSGGLTYNNGQVKLSIFGKSPFGRTKAKINHEYEQNGVPYSGTIISNGTGSTGTGNFFQLGLTGAEIFHNVSGLQTNKLYKWRARLQYDIASNPYQKLGPWKYYNIYNPLPHGNFRPSDGLTLDKRLNLTTLMQGFYNSAANTAISDTVTVFLRNSTAPYAAIDSSKGFLNSTGQTSLYFTNAINGVNYYLQVRHRNSVETWSKTTQTFTGNILNYDFTTAATTAFGNNMIQVDSSPIRYAIYNGDVNQDGTVDLTDNQMIDNDSYNFVFGYVTTDLNGDDAVDITDAAIADNNAYNFVSAVTP